MRYAWIDAQTNRFALAAMCDTLEVCISGFRAWKRGGTPDRKRLTAGQTLAMIRAIHAEVKGAYGSSRTVRELRQRGYTASKGRVERLMHLHGSPGGVYADDKLGTPRPLQSVTVRDLPPAPIRPHSTVLPRAPHWRPPHVRTRAVRLAGRRITTRPCYLRVPEDGALVVADYGKKPKSWSDRNAVND